MNVCSRRSEFYAERLLHADDKITLANSEVSLRTQVALVNEYVTSNN